MPKQSLFRLVKRWRRYQLRENVKRTPRHTRGLYVLYRRNADDYEVVYIGVAGLGPGGTGGIRGRLESHSRSARRANRRATKVAKNWTHYSMFEVHDNITREEIMELEAVLLAIFRHDPRVGLANKQKGSHKLYVLRNELHWK
jgi:hypothetical protein